MSYKATIYCYLKIFEEISLNYFNSLATVGNLQHCLSKLGFYSYQANGKIKPIKRIKNNFRFSELA